MQTVSSQIRVDPAVAREASALFDELGLDMSTAVNLFLRRCILCEGLPFPVEMPKYSEKTLAAMEEAKAVSADPTVKGYDSMEALKAALLMP